MWRASKVGFPTEPYIFIKGRVCVCVCAHARARTGHLVSAFADLVCNVCWECRCLIPSRTCLEDCLPLCLSSCQFTERDQLIFLMLAKHCCIDWEMFLLSSTRFLLGGLISIQLALKGFGFWHLNLWCGGLLAGVTRDSQEHGKQW